MEVRFINHHRFSSCLDNIVCDNLLADCYLLAARCYFRSERYNEVILECDKALSLNGTLQEVIKKRGEAYCLLHFYEKVGVEEESKGKGLADLRQYLSLQPNDRKIVDAYSYYYKKAYCSVIGLIVSEKAREKEQQVHKESAFNSFFTSFSGPHQQSSPEYRGMNRCYSETKSDHHESPFKSKRARDTTFHQPRVPSLSSRIKPDSKDLIPF